MGLYTFEGRAWVSVTPFTMWGIRPIFFPPLPVLSQSHEFNVRTYVHVEGVPGVWFFSLDASNALAVFGARLSLGLPYFRARMRLQEHQADTHFTSTRMHPGAVLRNNSILIALDANSCSTDNRQELQPCCRGTSWP